MRSAPEAWWEAVLALVGTILTIAGLSWLTFLVAVLTGMERVAEEHCIDHAIKAESYCYHIKSTELPEFLTK